MIILIHIIIMTHAFQSFIEMPNFNWKRSNTLIIITGLLVFMNDFLSTASSIKKYNTIVWGKTAFISIRFKELYSNYLSYHCKFTNSMDRMGYKAKLNAHSWKLCIVVTDTALFFNLSNPIDSLNKYHYIREICFCSRSHSRFEEADQNFTRYKLYNTISCENRTIDINAILYYCWTL